MRKFATKIVSRQNSVNHHSRAKFHIYFKQFKSWEEWEGWLLLLEPSYHYWVQVASHCDKVPPVKFKEKTGKYNVTRTCPSHQSVCPRQLRQGCWLWQGEAHSNGSWPPCQHKTLQQYMLLTWNPNVYWPVTKMFKGNSALENLKLHTVCKITHWV